MSVIPFQQPVRDIDRGQTVDDLLTAEDVIRILRLENHANPQDALRKICKRRGLPYIAVGPRTRRYDGRDLQIWIDQQKERSNGAPQSLDRTPQTG